jgi:hypothetical protein
MDIVVDIQSTVREIHMSEAIITKTNLCKAFYFVFIFAKEALIFFPFIISKNCIKY